MTFLDLVCFVLLATSAVWADVVEGGVTRESAPAATSIEDLAAAVRAAEDAERRACEVMLGKSTGAACEAR